MPSHTAAGNGWKPSRPQGHGRALGHASSGWVAALNSPLCLRPRYVWARRTRAADYLCSHPEGLLDGPDHPNSAFGPPPPPREAVARIFGLARAHAPVLTFLSRGWWPAGSRGVNAGRPFAHTVGFVRTYIPSNWVPKSSPADPPREVRDVTGERLPAVYQYLPLPVAGSATRRLLGS